MFSVGFGFFLFATISVVSVCLTIYHTNKAEKAAEIRKEELEVEMERLHLERAKIEHC